MTRRLRVLLLLGVAATCARADDEHDRIANERAAANALLVEQDRECHQKFVSAPCLDAARKAHRATLGRLRQEEIQLDETRRRAAAEQRRKEIAEKAQAQQERASAPEGAGSGASAPADRAARTPPKPPAKLSLPRGPQLPGLGVNGADRATAERLNTEKFEAKAQAAQQHREAVEKRNAERAAQGKVAAPLPIPEH